MAETVTITTVGHTVTITEGASQTVTATSAASQTIGVGLSTAPYTDAEARAAISAQAPDLSYNSSTGVMSYNQQTVSIANGGTGATDAATARSNIGADNASNLGKGLVPNARLTSVPINTFSDVDVDKTANNIAYTDGTTLRSRAASNWNLTDFTNDLTSGDLPAHTHAATDVTSGTFADARISQSSVTQHEAALAIAASQLTSGSLSIDLIPDTDQAYDLGSADYRWNDIHGDLDGPVIFRAKISGGGTLAVGDVVYIDGVSGEVPTVAKASASSASTMPAFGIISQGGSGSQDVHVTTLGSLTGIALATPTYAVGDTVYVSTTAGQFTTTPPTGESNLIQNIGYVAKTHASNGILKVGGAGRTNAVPNLNSGNIFYGNGSNQAVSTALTSVAATAAQGSLADSALQDVVDDTTPQLGGNLDVNGQSIVSASAGNILITPDTTGKIVLDGLSWPTADGTANQVLQTDGLGQLSFATASGGGDTNYTDRPHSTGGYVKLWYDFYNVVPNRLSPNVQANWWLGSGGSGTNIEESTLAGLRGGGMITINANTDRYMLWGPMIFDSTSAADGDELLWEARIYVVDSLATAGSAMIGLAEQTGSLAYNTNPFVGAYSSYDGVFHGIDLAQTYLRTGIKDTGSAGTGTQTDLTSYPLSSYVDTWVRLGIKCVYNSTDSDWDITYYVDGTSVGTDSMAFSSHIIPHLTAYVGTVSGNWSMHMDWISCQYKIGGSDTGRTTHLTLADL